MGARCRSGLWAAALSAALILIPSAALAEHGHRLPHCAPYPLEVLAADRHAEVFEHNLAVFACSRQKHIRRFLGHGLGAQGPVCLDQQAEKCGLLSMEVIAGTAVAYAERRSGEHNPPPNSGSPQGGWSSLDLVVRSITSGKVLHKVPLGVVRESGGAFAGAEPVSILLKPNGTVAWIQLDGYGSLEGNPVPPTGFDLFAVDTRGFHTFAVSLPAPPKETKLVGNRLTWTVSGTPHSARLN